MTRSHSAASAMFLGCALTGLSANAQQATDTTAGAQGNAAAGATAQATPPANQQAQMGMALPTATAAAQPAGASDHDAVVGHLAVGFLGRATIPYGAGPTGTLQAPVPVIGVRYWMDPMLGLDLGLGLWLGKTSTDATAAGVTTTTSGPKPASFVIHAGVPLALASSKHFVFEITPEANFGLASVTQDAALTGTGITKQSGTHFDIGARAGAEIHFGFIGLPQLSLLGSVGLRFDYDSLTTETNPPAGPGKVSSSVWNLGTTVYDSPWNIFIGNVGALYYF